MIEKIHSNILIRAPNWLGDTLMSTPGVSAVRKIFPKAKLSILAKSVFCRFWKDFPGVDEVISYEKGFSKILKVASQLKKNKFDMALVFPTSFSSAFIVFLAEIPIRIGWGGEGRDLFLTQVVPHPRPRQKHLVLEYMDLVQKGLETSLKPVPEKLICAISDKSRKEIAHAWQAAGLTAKSSPIALAPGATYGPAKRWPLPYWKELIGFLLADRKESILIVGGREEEDYLRPLIEGFPPKYKSRIRIFVGRTSPTLLAAMLSKCKILVTNDTGPMHVAAAVGTPTVALFGSTSPTWTMPFGIGHEVIYKQLGCSPCFQRTCPIGYKCLHAINVDDVYKAVQKILHKPKKIKG
jgi:heptosyltransferase-2